MISHFEHVLPFSRSLQIDFSLNILVSNLQSNTPFYLTSFAGDTQRKHPKMQSILRWSLENSTPDNAAGDPPAERKDLDPAIIDYILGKPDSVQMKEDIAVAVDSSKSEDERINALDHLEMVSL